LVSNQAALFFSLFYQKTNCNAVIFNPSYKFAVYGKSKKKTTMLNLILFGPPGSGKGTQVSKLVDKYNLLHISTGDLFRYELSHNTELGQLARSYMDKGLLVPDEVTIAMLEKKVNAHPEVQGYIFDGFPRTIPQARALDGFLKSKNQSISGLIVKRLLLRGQSSGRADDTNEDVIRKRIAVYRNETTPVFDYYAQFNKSYKVEGVGSVETIFSNLIGQIQSLNRTQP
jgi:adenylate kinase